MKHKNKNKEHSQRTSNKKKFDDKKKNQIFKNKKIESKNFHENKRIKKTQNEHIIKLLKSIYLYTFVIDKKKK